MANYQLGPVIGKLGGGAEIEEIPVSTPGASNSTSHLLTVDAGDGAWIFVEGTLTWSTSSTSVPELIVGTRTYRSSGPRAGGGGHFTGEVVISLRSNHHYTDSPFSGTVHVIR